jgi:RHS repeat-associated protein
MIKPGELAYYFHNDHLGTPQVLTSDSQAVAWKAVYTPFGEGVASITTVDNPFRFPGQYYDPETGLHYNYFRYYNPQTGRYITPDPIGLEGGINLFVHVAGNPLRWIDPWGLRTEVIITGGTWYGHAALRINNTVYSAGRYDPTSVYSYGLKGANILTVWNYNDYIRYYQNDGRSSTGYVLSLTPAQEEALRAYYDRLLKEASRTKEGYKLKNDYKFFSENCATTVAGALQDVLPWYDDLWIDAFYPYQLEFHLVTMPWLVKETVPYPAKK